ncbi:YbaB/EbfC family nucleoid-associated protein [Actinokineospora enzanensis]|uniref:YbaB/EbfC family nucleoid-associated protein n=1 Tax=Actinokineospora enzanensis TaxID=155975 RepID=UPI00035E7CDC|nr:YbaB/EbfC family nucleoid-associated protein [Actinokineospora enzanensis]
MQTPDEWLASFEAQVAELQEKATRFKEAVESSSASSQSADGAVTVDVAASGALTGLRLTEAALGRGADELATEILALTARARQTAADGVATAFVPLGGNERVVQRVPQPSAEEPAAPRQETEEYFEQPAVYRDDEKW